MAKIKITKSNGIKYIQVETPEKHFILQVAGDNSMSNAQLKNWAKKYIKNPVTGKKKKVSLTKRVSRAL